MVVIRCTQKLFTEMAVRPLDLAEAKLTTEPNLEEWYANLTVIQRQKIVVFINPATLFVLPAFGLHRSDLRDFRAVFLNSLTCTLTLEGVEPAVIQKLTARFDTLQIAKTCNRRTLGCLNDVIRIMTCQVGDIHSLTPEAIINLTKQLNRIPWVKTDFIYATIATEPILQRHFGWKGQFEP